MEFESTTSEVLDLLFDDSCGLLKDDLGYVRTNKHGFIERSCVEQDTVMHNINFVSICTQDKGDMIDTVQKLICSN